MSAASPTSSNAGKENDTAEQLHNLKRRGDNYQPSKQFHLLTEKLCRVPGRIDIVVTKAKAKAREELSQLFSFTLKEKLKGVVPDSARDLINDFVALDGVRPNKACWGKLGIEVTGNAADHIMRRLVRKGRVASHMQFVDAVGTSKDAHKLFCFESSILILSVTISSDETTHKNINHTSEKQLEGWEDLIETAYKIYKTSERSKTADDASGFWLEVKGCHSDHAQDQKKLFRLVAATKISLERERRGTEK
ncbi:hypothetical protein DFH09DRAFT_1085977 [Mycena vulgaris]|nr:hypothetical protein DFH09DRAFT_1085977 [Mycena vulgaris]